MQNDLQHLRDEIHRLRCELETAQQQITWLSVGYNHPGIGFVTEQDRQDNVRRCQHFGTVPGHLLNRWSVASALPWHFNRSEAEAAILDALVTQGVKAWSGDASSCVTNIVEAVWYRPHELKVDTSTK